MSRTARLLELLVRVQTRPRFTAAELAEEFGVSRRTMLRDLRALSDMGVPLRSTPGPGGGYSLPRGGRRLWPSLTVDEALGLIVSYEALLRYPVHPFSSQGVPAMTKLRAALPKDVVGELDRLRRHVAVEQSLHLGSRAGDQLPPEQLADEGVLSPRIAQALARPLALRQRFMKGREASHPK